MDQPPVTATEDDISEQIRARFRCAGNNILMLELQEILIRREHEEHVVPDMPLTEAWHAKGSSK